MSKSKNLPNKDDAVTRSFGIPDIRAIEIVGQDKDDKGNVVEGHPAVYDQKVAIGHKDDPWFYEIIERGAFDGCDFDDVLFSANHRWRDKIPLARSRRNNKSNKESTMQIALDDKGLYFRANLDLERNADALALYSSVDRGDIDGMSFIFYVGEEKWEGLDTKAPTRRIQKIAKVREVSAVNFEAYSATDIYARNDQSALENAKKALDNARSTLDNEKNELDLALEKLRFEKLY